MSKQLKVTISFWSIFALSPILIIVMDSLLDPVLSTLHLLSPLIVKALPVWIVASGLNMVIIYTFTTGRLAIKQLDKRPITRSLTDKITLGLAIFVMIVILAAILIKLTINDQYRLDYLLNDCAVLTTFPLLIWITYKAWQQVNRNWILLGIIVQILFTTLFGVWWTA
jgi:hypothetical protein